MPLILKADSVQDARFAPRFARNVVLKCLNSYKLPVLRSLGVGG